MIWRSRRPRSPACGPSGARDLIRDVAVDQLVVIREGEGLIAEQGRQPATPAFEALYALVRGDLTGYAALDDADVVGGARLRGRASGRPPARGRDSG